MASRYRLTPVPEQEIALREHCAHARFVWNLAVEQQSWWWPGRSSAPGAVERSRQLADARAAEPWLAAGSSSVQQQALRDFDRAMAAFFDRQNPAGKPSYRNRRGTQGFVVRDVKPQPKPDPDKGGAYLPNRRRQKAGLNRGVLGSCWGLLATRTEQKAVASGVAVVYVDPKYSSQECRRCGHVAGENRESQAVFRCVACGNEDHADANAARNVLARGLACLAVPAQAPGLRGVRPRKTSASPGAAGTTREAA